MPLAVMVRSVLDNLAEGYRLHLHIVDGGITETTKWRMVKSWPEGAAAVRWLNASGLLPNVMVSGYISEAAYLRLLIPALLPVNVEKAIYLDSDVVVLGNLGDLWDLPFEGKPLLAAQDCAAPILASPMGLLLYKELGYAPHEKYLNSGVLVMNLSLWRAQEIASKIFHYLDKYREFVQFHDQDGLNAVLAGQWGVLDPRWNQMSQLFGFSSWRESPFEETVFHQTRDDPLVIHYSSKRKPWHPDYANRNRKFFYRYLDCTDWLGWRPRWTWNATWPGKLLARAQKMVGVKK